MDVLLAVTAELRRVLAPHGSICIELGDTYAGSGGGGGDYLENGLREGQQQFAGSAASMRESNAAHWRQKNQDKNGWPLAKSKALIPELYRIALAYGVNPLTGQPSPAGQWRVRNVVTWCRPNPPVGSLGDKWRPATSDVVVACVSSKRYWDDLATRTEHTEPGAVKHRIKKHAETHPGTGWATDNEYVVQNPHGAPLLDWWSITAGGFAGAHYAVWPSALVGPLVKAMAPPRVCRTCGEPSRRIVEPSPEYASRPNAGRDFLGPVHDRSRGMAARTEKRPGSDPARLGASFTTLGWTDCGHDNYRPALVLDCFAGSGTTLSVATGHGHDAIGIDLDPRNADLALDRVGPLLLEVQS